MTMSDPSPVLHPEILRLTGENALLREELTRLLAEADDLLQIIKPNLLALYQTRIGVWELQALQAQCAVARWRRQVELAQASINRGERPDPISIEGALELEFLAWRTKIREVAERIEAAEARLKHLLSPVAARELKKLYYALVKRLHPDMNPNLTDDQRRLWQRVQSAYQSGDLEELRALALLGETPGPVAPPPKSPDQLLRDQKILERQIALALEQAEKIESQPPFSLRPQLEDETWLAARRQELERQTAAWREQAPVLEAHWKTLLGEAGHGTIFGKN